MGNYGEGGGRLQNEMRAVIKIWHLNLNYCIFFYFGGDGISVIGIEKS